LPQKAESKNMKTAIRQNTKDQIVDLALELISQKGYGGFSYQDIADVMGIKKASIHYHFASKDDLAVAVVDRFHTLVHEWIRDNSVAGMTPLQKLEAYFRFHAQMTQNFQKICPLCSFMTEWQNLSGVIQKKMENFDKWHMEFIVGIIREGQEAGEIRKDSTPEEMAMFLISGTMGALNTARERGSEAAYYSITGQIIKGMRCR